ncbi:hypothetical protein EU520_00235 [Candidatus Thorarchaeota archaeon]|nr:MAG: hypothetical protein EU520_00235 [Candidatus Thorarchaeota archaeon]
MKLEREYRSRKITLEARWIGDDFATTIYGGDAAHIGGVSIATVSESKHRGVPTVSVSTVSVPGHKEFVLSAPLAERICRRTHCTVTLMLGVHFDDATSGDIDAVSSLLEDLVSEMLSKMPTKNG